jgi:hypothetical protein
MHGFDNNLAHLGLGTLDRPDWKIQDRAEAYATRAAAARGGLWGNHGYEATYAMAWTDADDDPLDGAQNCYELRLSPPPPVDAFWSLTGSARQGQAIELAADAQRQVPPVDPHVPATRGDPHGVYILPAITKVR